MIDAQLEAELDQLFQVHPAEMVKARNALAEQLRKRGNKDGALFVKGLARPTSAAWALNRLSFEQPELLEQARAQAERVRALHAESQLDVAQLRQAVASQRAAVAAVVAAAERCCAAFAIPTGPPHQRKLLFTVQGWLAGMGEQRPGRMTKDLEPGGFEGVRVVADSAPARVSEKEAPAASLAKVARKPDARALAEARQALEREQQRAREAREQVRRRHVEQGTASASLQGIARRLLEAERAVEELRSQQARADAQLRACDAELAQAEDLQRQANASVAAARDKLDELEAHET